MIIFIVVLILGIVYSQDQYDNLYSKICYENNTSICDSKIFCEQPWYIQTITDTMSTSSSI